MEKLTSLDAQFLAIENGRVYGHVSGLAILDPSTTPSGEITIKDICELVSQRVHLLPPFRRRLAHVPFDLDHPSWIEDPEFEIEFHVRESAVPPPGSAKDLAKIVERIVARPLDRGRPLWEAYLIHGLENGRVGLLMKVHHAAVDGLAGAAILGVLFDNKAEVESIPVGELPPQEEMPSDLTMLARGLAALPRQPLHALRNLPIAAGNLADIPGAAAIPGIKQIDKLATRIFGALPGEGGGEILETTAVRAPLTRFNAPISAQRRVAFSSLSLPKIKAVKNALGITVNDVVVAICAAGLREWLLEHDELPDEPLVAMIPLSVRSMEELGDFGNRVAAMFVQIPTDLSDPYEQLRTVHETLAVAKTRFQAVPADILQDITEILPAALLTRASRLIAQLGAVQLLRPMNVVISNVPGPREQLYCAGAALEADYPLSVITDGIGLNITALSYKDKVDIGIVADRHQMDDVWPLMQAIERALDRFDDVVGGLGLRQAE